MLDFAACSPPPYSAKVGKYDRVGVYAYCFNGKPTMDLGFRVQAHWDLQQGGVFQKDITAIHCIHTYIQLHSVCALGLLVLY